jgi:hypothetical protein
MPYKRTAPRRRSRPTHQRASQESGLIATGRSVRHSAEPKAALDNRSHRTPEVDLQGHLIRCGGGAAATIAPLAGATHVRRQAE